MGHDQQNYGAGRNSCVLSNQAWATANWATFKLALLNHIKMFLLQHYMII